MGNKPRNKTQGSYFLLFDAMLNFDHLDAGNAAGSKGEVSTTEQYASAVLGVLAIGIFGVRYGVTQGMDRLNWIHTHTMKFATLFCALTVCSSAGEYAVLSTGFRVHADRHETSGDMVRLHTRDGAIELPASTVVSFEDEEVVAAPPVVAAPAPVAAPSSAITQPMTPQDLVSQAARLAGLPPALVHSVARAESAYQVKAISNKGAIGLMQLMPGTAAALHADPHDPKQNAEAGAMYLRELLLKYDGTVSKALAAYNAGPGAVDKYHGVPPYRETINYVNRVIQQYEKNQPSQ